MEPNLPQVLQQYSIDLIITASPGYAHYPWNQIKNIPIILLNIFGSPTLQKNIKATIYNSQTTKNHAENWIGEDKQGYVMYAPLYNLPPKNVRELGKTLRSKLGIKETDFVFGRIGRADDSIFDPIGIRAWQSIVNDHPEAHLIVMSPAPALVKIVESENIPRVHLIPPSNREEDVWSLHGSLDVFAHFRYDGETSGVAIAESLTVGNPIITHQSKIWNAHLEYLTNEFARIANIDSISDYTRSMEEFINIRNNSPETWREMQTRSMEIAEENFSSDRYSHFINQLVRNILQIQNNL
jgi:glycosyltransferase involved in cell wall biosynthesis